MRKCNAIIAAIIVVLGIGLPAVPANAQTFFHMCANEDHSLCWTGHGVGSSVDLREDNVGEWTLVPDGICQGTVCDEIENVDGDCLVVVPTATVTVGNGCGTATLWAVYTNGAQLYFQDTNTGNIGGWALAHQLQPSYVIYAEGKTDNYWNWVSL
jgi:hypothetical protein